MKKIIGVILLALSIMGTIGFVKKMSDGSYKDQPTGNSAYDSGRKAGRYSVPFVVVALGIYGLRLLLSSDDAPAAPTAPRRAPVIPRAPSADLPPPGHPSLRGGQDTFASNPGMIKLDINRWLMANPSVLAIIGVLAAITLVVLFVRPQVAALPLVTAAVVIWRQVREAKQKFWGGDVCPGVVLSAQQGLVAVYTNLMAGSRQAYPAIKILKQPLNRMTAEPAYDGMRIATVALYHGDARQAAWLDFSPEVINCVVQDPGEIQRVRGSISEEDWQLLDGWLAHVPTATPGLYRMWEMVQPDGTPVENYVASGTPWFKQKPAIIGLSIFGGFAALVFAFYLLGIFLNWHNQHRASRPSAYTPPPPSSHSFPAGAHPSMSELTQTGPFMIDSKIEANWAGGWVPGTITKINGGGHSVMVQLEDSRWPTSIVFSTNQIRLK